MITFIYTLHIAIILFFGTISNLTHTSEISQKRIQCQFDNNNIKEELPLNVLKTSKVFNDMFENREPKNNELISIQLCSAKDFNNVYPGMKQLITGGSNSTKQRLIHNIYAKKTIDELIPALSTANKLDIPPITETLTSCIAQKADLLSHKEQNNLLKKIQSQVGEAELTKLILSRMVTRIPSLIEVPLTQSDYDNDKLNIMFDNIITHAFDATKKTLVLCSHKDNNKDQVFLYDSEKECYNFLTSFTGTNRLTLDWSPSGDHVIYKYVNTKWLYKDKTTIGYFSIDNPQQKIDLTTDTFAAMHIHPQQDIIYLLNGDLNDSTGPLEIYDLNTGKLIDSYESTDFCATQSGWLQTPKKFLSPDGKLLLIPEKDKWTLINTKTNTPIAGWPKEENRISWANGHLIVEKLTSPFHKGVLDKKYSINYSNFEDNMVLPHITKPHKYAKHDTDLGIASIVLLAAYIIYCPEEFL